MVWDKEDKVVKNMEQMSETADIEFVDGKVKVKKEGGY